MGMEFEAIVNVKKFLVEPFGSSINGVEQIVKSYKKGENKLDKYKRALLWVFSRRKDWISRLYMVPHEDEAWLRGVKYVLTDKQIYELQALMSTIDWSQMAGVHT